MKLLLIIVLGLMIGGCSQPPKEKVYVQFEKPYWNACEIVRQDADMLKLDCGGNYFHIIDKNEVPIRSYK